MVASLLGLFAISPLQTQAFALDDVVRNVITFLRAENAALKAENATLKAQVASCSNVSARRSVADKQESECDALSDDITVSGDNLLAFEKETNKRIAELKKNPSGMSSGALNDTISAFIRPRDVTYREMSNEKNTLQSQWNRECR